MGISLYPHNLRAYKAARKKLIEACKAAVIHPTGTGKSFIGFKLAEDESESRICWLSPSEYIYKTQVENLKAAGGLEPANVEFVSYAKLMMSDASYISSLRPDYIILDEFHRCGATEWGKGVERLLAAYPSAKLLGLSATNIRYYVNQALDRERERVDEFLSDIFQSKVSS